MRHKAFLISTWLICILTSVSVSADSVLIDFKSTPDGFGRQFKIVKILPDESKKSCTAGLYVGLQGKNSQSSTLIANKQLIACDGKDFLSVNEIVNKYADIIGRDVWTTVTDASSMVAHWTGACLVTMQYVSSLTEPLTCSDLTPSNVSCTITGGDITFNHGTVQSKNVDGKSISKNINVDCTGDTDATITIGPSFNVYNGTIPLNADNSLRAVMSVNGVQNSTGKTFHLNTGQNTLSIGSTLRTSNTSLAGGKYSGTGVLVITPQ
ncbi:hypothetical protein ACFZFR_003728 [Salmonella enterica]